MTVMVQVRAEAHAELPRGPRETRGSDGEPSRNEYKFLIPRLASAEPSLKRAISMGGADEARTELQL